MEQLSWFVFSIAATIFFGIAMALYKIPSFKNQSRYVIAFWAMAISFILALIFFNKFLYLASPQMIGMAFLWGFSFSLLVMLQMYALKNVNTHTLFPTTSILSLIITILIGFLFFKEIISTLQFLGIILVIFLVYFYLHKKGKLQYSKQILLSGLGIIFFSVANKVIHKVVTNNYNIHAYQILQYFGAMIFSFLIVLYVYKKDFKKHFSKKSFLSGSLIGLLMFLGGYTFLIALTRGPFILITAIHSLYIFVTAIVGALLFKEKLDKKIILLLILSIVALIIIKLG
jgi:bacterial/archaeal transporter family protein